MSLRTEKFPEVRAILFTFTPPLSMPADVITGLTESAAFKREIGAPISRIFDLTQIAIRFTDILMGLAIEKGFEGGFYDPEVYTVILGQEEWLTVGLEVMKSHPSYKKTNVVGSVHTREEALALAQKLAETRRMPPRPCESGR